MRILRPILMCVLIAGIGLTLGVGSSSVRQTGAGAQVGYGDFGPTGIGGDTVPPRSFTIAASGLDDLSWLLVAAIVVAVLAVIALLAWGARSGRISLPGSRS